MQNAAINNARDLADPVKSAIETLLGRSLKDDEQVSVRTYRRHAAPRGEARQRAARRLQKHLTRMAGKVKHTSRAAMDSAIDEALNHLRPKRS